MTITSMQGLRFGFLSIDETAPLSLSAVERCEQIYALNALPTLDAWKSEKSS
jgi:hypothetical protein